MKILLITPYFFEPHRWMVSGYKAALSLSALGYDVVVFTSGSKGQPKVEELSPNLKIYRFRDLFIPDPVNFGIVPFMFPRLWSVIRRERPTHFLVYKYMFYTSLSVYLLKLLRKRVVVVTDTFPGVSWFSRSKLVNAVMWIYSRTIGLGVLRLADRVVLLHEGLVETAEKLGLRRIRVHPNGVDMSLFEHVTEPADVDHDNDDAVVVTYVGRLESVKGYDLLLDVAEKIVARHANVRFLFVGDTQNQTELVVRYQGDAIRFLGHREDVPALLSVSDIFVLPSYSEGLPNALMEAMASGCACVATHVGGVPWLLEKTCAGVTIPAGDPNALENAIERLIDDRELRERYAARAREVIDTRYRLDQLSEELVEILKAA